MKGYWHIVLIVSAASIVIVISEKYLLIIFPLLWLIYLFMTERLSKQPFTVSLFTLAFLIFYIPSSINEHDVLNNASSFEINMSGKVTQPLHHTKNKIQFTLEEQSTTRAFSVIYFLKDKQIPPKVLQMIKHGATCQVTGEFNRPEKNSNPGEFNFQAYLYEQGIHGQVFVKSLADIHCQGASFLHYIYEFRQFLINRVEDYYPLNISAWIQALVLGSSDNLPEEIIDLFQRWSLSHILAISGLHVGIIIGSIYFIFVSLGVLTKETTEWMLLSILPIYTFIAGGDPSVLRATLMIIFFLLFNKFKASYQLTDVLSIVCLLLIIINPKIVYHLGFQFSFLVTFSLLLSRKWIQQSTPLWQLAKISYVAQLIILPLQFHYFHTFQPLSILINLIVVPYFSFIVIPFMFLLLIFSLLLPKTALLLTSIYEPIHQFFLEVLLAIDDVIHYYFVLGDFPLLIAIIYYIVLIFSFQKLEKYQLLAAFKYSLILVLMIIGLWLRPYLSPEGSVTMLDIGQGDAFVIELPYREAIILVDASATMSYDPFKVKNTNYEFIIKPYLYSRGIQSIDAIIISHEHVDHNGSVNYIVEEMDPSQIFISKYYEINKNEREIWNKKKVDIIRLQAKDQFKVKGQTFFVLSPDIDQKDPDDNSLVFVTTLGGKKWLFTGDISTNIEQKIIQQFPNLKVDVLKVAHHGSDTSTDEQFIERIRPKYAVMSVGRNNQYNHPADKVIDTLNATGANIFRTDQHGAVQFNYYDNVGTFTTTLQYNN